MSEKRVFNFNGANVTFNDIHDNHNCTIIVPKGKELPEDFCTYIVPNAAKSREEIEADLIRESQKPAAKFREFLHNYRINGYLDFRHETPSQIYDTLNNRYNLPYDKGNFTRDWNV